MRKQIVIAVLAGQLLGLLGYIDPIFIPFVLAGPPIVGAVAAARRVPLVPVMVLWASAGVNMLWMDWVLLQEDVAFHAVLVGRDGAARGRRLGPGDAGEPVPQAGGRAPCARRRWIAMVGSARDSLSVVGAVRRPRGCRCSSARRSC